MAPPRRRPPPGTEARKELDRVRTRLWKKTHKEQVRAAAKAYREKHRLVLREKGRLGNMPPEKQAQRRQWRKNYHAANAQFFRNYQLARNYGLSSAQFDELLARQDYHCALCHGVFDNAVPKLRPAIDHDHSTGVIRGILHANCNSGLGFFNDDPNRCYLAATYLAVHHARRKDPLSVPVLYRGLPPKRK